MGIHYFSAQFSAHRQLSRPVWHITPTASGFHGLFVIDWIMFHGFQAAITWLFYGYFACSQSADILSITAKMHSQKRRPIQYQLFIHRLQPLPPAFYYMFLSSKFRFPPERFQSATSHALLSLIFLIIDFALFLDYIDMLLPPLVQHKSLRAFIISPATSAKYFLWYYIELFALYIRIFIRDYILGREYRHFKVPTLLAFDINDARRDRLRVLLSFSSRAYILTRRIAFNILFKFYQTLYFCDWYFRTFHRHARPRRRIPREVCWGLRASRFYAREILYPDFKKTGRTSHAWSCAWDIYFLLQNQSHFSSPRCRHFAPRMRRDLKMAPHSRATYRRYFGWRRRFAAIYISLSSSRPRLQRLYAGYRILRPSSPHALMMRYWHNAVTPCTPRIRHGASFASLIYWVTLRAIEMSDDMTLIFAWCIYLIHWAAFSIRRLDA